MNYVVLPLLYRYIVLYINKCECNEAKTQNIYDYLLIKLLVCNYPTKCCDDLQVIDITCAMSLYTCK